MSSHAPVPLRQALSGPWPALRVLGLLTSAALLAGCETAPVVRQAEDLYQTLLVKSRSSGERQLADAATVARELGCAPHSTVARIDSSAVLPERARPGREISHRLVVSTCAPAGIQPEGRLTRRFTHQGRTLFEDAEALQLKPGRWAIDVFIGIPPQARHGAYRLTVRLDVKGLTSTAGTDFTVVAP